MPHEKVQGDLGTLRDVPTHGFDRTRSSADAGDEDHGEFSNAETFIKMVEKSGLKLTSPFDYTVDDDTFYSHPYKVVSLVFEKT